MASIPIAVKINPEDLYKIRLFCINHNMTVSRLIKTALKEYLSKYNVEISGE